MEQLETEHGIFTNNETTGKTAQEVYEEWLLNKDKPRPKTEEEKLKERISALEDALLFLMDIGGM